MDDMSWVSYMLYMHNIYICKYRCVLFIWCMEHRKHFKIIISCSRDECWDQASVVGVEIIKSSLDCFESYHSIFPRYLQRLVYADLASAPQMSVAPTSGISLSASKNDWSICLCLGHRCKSNPLFLFAQRNNPGIYPSDIIRVSEMGPKEATNQTLFCFLHPGRSCRKLEKTVYFPHLWNCSIVVQ